MALYEMTIEAAAVEKAKALVSLAGRSFPTLVMRWESRLFDQTWTTTIVLDYLLALPPLMVGQATFNEVRIGAYVGGAPTKFLYFGTEMTADVPRIAPEMENLIGAPQQWQEFRLEERTCPLPYLKLIQATPRIFGNGPQDYYSPPIKVERYDGTPTPALIADFFPAIVADLDPVRGDLLTDPARGFWTGSRYVGPMHIAILRQGNVVGLHQRAGRPEKDAAPSEVKKRDPRLDVLKHWVAIDVGTRSTVAAIRGERGSVEHVRLGTRAPASRPSDFENPSELRFTHVGRTVKAWRDRVILPMTRWEDVQVGHAARTARIPVAPPPRHGKPPVPAVADPAAVACCLGELPLLRERIERREAIQLRGEADPESTETLKPPAPAVIDEDGIGAHDPFDPVELYAYYLGLNINVRSRGLVLRYALSMPTGWSDERRTSVLVAFRRGLFRSLPAGLVAYEDLEGLEVIDGGPAALAFAVHALRAFNVVPTAVGVPICIVDAGASETGIAHGLYRLASPEEREMGLERVIEYLPTESLGWLGGERLLHRMAAHVHLASHAFREQRVPMEAPVAAPQSDLAAELGELAATTAEARANTVILKDLVRPILEGDPTVRTPVAIKLFAADGRVVEVPVSVDREELAKSLADSFAAAGGIVRESLAGAAKKIGKGPDPYEGFHVFLGGRLSMHPALADEIVRDLPASVKVHRFIEPGRENLAAATVKTATAQGLLSMRLERVGLTPRKEKRDAFAWRVGRARHGQLADALDPSAEYDAWREAGACSKPEVEVLYVSATGDVDVAADDPRVKRAVCALGMDAMGKRLYMRAVTATRVEVSVGPPGGEPDADAPLWAVDLVSGAARALRS